MYKNWNSCNYLRIILNQYYIVGSVSEPTYNKNFFIYIRCSCGSDSMRLDSKKTLGGIGAYMMWPVYWLQV